MLRGRVEKEGEGYEGEHGGDMRVGPGEEMVGQNGVVLELEEDVGVDDEVENERVIERQRQTERYRVVGSVD